MRFGFESISNAVRKPGRGLQIGVIAGVVLLVLMAVAAYALDASNKDKIAKGVSVGGVDLGARPPRRLEASCRRTSSPR